MNSLNTLHRTMDITSAIIDFIKRMDYWSLEKERRWQDTRLEHILAAKAIKYANKQQLEQLSREYPGIVILLRDDYDKDIISMSLLSCFSILTPTINSKYINLENIVNLYTEIDSDIINKRSIKYSSIKWLLCENYEYSLTCNLLKYMTFEHDHDLVEFVEKFDGYNTCYIETDRRCETCDRVHPKYIKNKQTHSYDDIMTGHIANNTVDKILVDEFIVDSIARWNKKQITLKDAIECITCTTTPFVLNRDIDRLIVMPNYIKIYPIPDNFIELKINIITQYSEDTISPGSKYIYVSDKTHLYNLCEIHDIMMIIIARDDIDWEWYGERLLALIYNEENTGR